MLVELGAGEGWRERSLQGPCFAIRIAFMRVTVALWGSISEMSPVVKSMLPKTHLTEGGGDEEKMQAENEGWLRLLHYNPGYQVLGSRTSGDPPPLAGRKISGFRDSLFLPRSTKRLHKNLCSPGLGSWCSCSLFMLWDPKSREKDWPTQHKWVSPGHQVIFLHSLVHSFIPLLVFCMSL